MRKRREWIRKVSCLTVLAMLFCHSVSAELLGDGAESSSFSQEGLILVEEEGVSDAHTADEPEAEVPVGGASADSQLSSFQEVEDSGSHEVLQKEAGKPAAVPDPETASDPAAEDSPAQELSDGLKASEAEQVPPAVSGGKCGDNLNWSYNTSTKILTITGSGDMYNYSSGSPLIPWFDYRSQINFVVLPSGLTRIGKFAFATCYNITGMSIPSTVKSIGERAFAETRISSLSIPSSGTKLDPYALAEMDSLKTVSLPSGMTSLPDHLFFRCTALTSVSIPSSVTTLGEGMFSACKALKSVTIGSGVTTIPSSFLMDCTSLSSFTIPSSVLHIDHAAFMNCSSLASITLPAGLQKMGNFVFYGTSLKTVTIPGNVTSVGQKAFDRCYNLNSVRIGNPSMTVSYNCFCDCTNLKTIYFNGSKASWNTFKTSLVKATGNSPLLNAPNVYYVDSGKCGSSLTWSIDTSVGTLKITGSGTMYNYTALTGRTYHDYVSSIKKIEMPSGMTSIGDMAFSGCSKLETVTLPASVKTIGKEGFKGCSALTGINLPSGLTSLGESAFSLCSSMTSVYIPGNVKTIPAYCFSNCKKLSGITLTSGLQSIGNYAFYYCESLKYLTLPSSVTQLGNSAFSCSGLVSIGLPKSITRIPQFAFSSCTNLIGIELGEKIETVEARAFMGCTSMNNVTIKNKNMKVLLQAFSGCTKIANVYYSGTEAEWKAMTIESGNEPLLKANIHCKAAAAVPMHRLFNTTSGEHFYTANTDEKNMLVNLGWVYEGIGWYAPGSGGSPVIYRLYNPKKGFEEHHYTSDQNEINVLKSQGWNLEGPAWASDPAKGVPVYRLFNPKAINSASSHHYTTDLNEKNTLVNSYGWNYEGIAWYGVKV